MNKSLLRCILICFAVAFCDSVEAQDAWGNLKGSIKVTGEVPEVPRLVINKDRASCLAGKPAPLDDNLIVGKTGELKDVFVMMYLKGDKPAVHPSYQELKSKPVVLDNKDCRFAPHAFFIRTGQPLHLKNSDKVGHNCHGKMFNNEFNVNVPQDDVVKIKLEDKEKVPGLIVCDIHPWMDSVVLVRDEPYVAITDKNGIFEIKNIPAGTWKFQFWHQKSGYLRDLEVTDKKVGRRGEIEVEITDGQTLDLGEMTIDGSELDK